MREATVEYHDDDYNVQLVVVQCSLERGFRRSALQAENAVFLKKRESEGGAIEFQERYVAFHTHPECIAATKEIHNLDGAAMQFPDTTITLEDFLKLPEALIVLWEKAVYALNPHWVPELPSVLKKKIDQGELNRGGSDQGEVKEPGNS